ncbi:MAG: stage IV sporulation protein A [Clostridia bacterium]|nr:stage IV sporulation protein A [Clostridia bacterium]
MLEQNIYKDIAERCGGNIYVGVVGPVRTGKSTLIQRFMEALVLPNMAPGGARDRARDELPQAAAGRTVMTTEPKFIPEEAVSVLLDGNAEAQVRLIDCVGYMIEGALGGEEGGQTRMVKTPWSPEPMPFSLAAETGTEKVIREHSTVGMVVTTDGSIGDIDRAAYVEAEERVVRELGEIGKPFALILNSAHPEREDSRALAYELEEKYKVPVALVNCMELDAEDIRQILGMLLTEFPVTELTISLPAWTSSLAPGHKIRTSLEEGIKKAAAGITKVADVEPAFHGLSENEYIASVAVDHMDLGSGKASLSLATKPELYYQALSELTGLSIADDGELFCGMLELTAIKEKYEKVAAALSSVEETGYGIVMPEVEDLKLEEPKIVKQSGGYGVRLRAAAPSIHMIRANIEAEINPMVGTEAQSEDMVRYLLKEFEADPASIWNSNLFGKSLYDLINEGLHKKLERMPEESREKLSTTLERIINEGSQGLICILL